MNIRNVITSGGCGLVVVALAICGSSEAFAQSAPVFAPGSIVVSRTTYTGTTATVQFPGTPAEQCRLGCGRELSGRLQQRDTGWFVRRNFADFYRPDDKNGRTGQYVCAYRRRFSASWV